MRHRFHSICPYFAMFPEDFAERWIAQTTAPGQLVLDPFSGRGTAPFQARLMGREAIGSDVNPVAYVLTAAKLDTPGVYSVFRRISQLRDVFDPHSVELEYNALPPFFRRAFHHATLRQILFVREHLSWQNSRVDRFIAALALGSLHGEMFSSRSYFSNQMPRTISTKPAYSLRFWEGHRLYPQKRDVFGILRQRAEFRFESAVPAKRGVAFLTDVRDLPFRATNFGEQVDCVLTSPPYLDITNFEEDQWLRLWFLGGNPHPCPKTHSHDDRHERPEHYWAFLCDAWKAVRPLLKSRATMIVRIGGKDLTAPVIRDALCASMQFVARKWTLAHEAISYFPRRQTDAFHPGTVGCRFEVDFCFALRQ